MPSTKNIKGFFGRRKEKQGGEKFFWWGGGKTKWSKTECFGDDKTE